MSVNTASANARQRCLSLPVSPYFIPDGKRQEEEVVREVVRQVQQLPWTEGDALASREKEGHAMRRTRGLCTPRHTPFLDLVQHQLELPVL